MGHIIRRSNVMRSKKVELTVGENGVSLPIPKEYIDKLGGVHADYEVFLEPIEWDRADNPIKWCIQIERMQAPANCP